MLALLAAVTVVAPIQVTPPLFGEAKEPQVAIDIDHHVYIAYGKGDGIYLSISSDGGKTYGDPIRVAEVDKLALGMRRGPRITAFRGVITITAASHGDGNLMAYKSSNAGKNWRAPTRVNDSNGSAREGLHAMAASPEGTLACTWLDLRSKGTKLYIATSKDGGGSWGSNRLVYESPSGSICECCHPSVAFDSTGKLFVMFRNSLDGARDMYLTSSTDLGRTFSTATKLGQGTWMLDACPMDGGSLGVTGQNEVQAIWRREGTLYRDGFKKPERLFAEGKQGWITSTAAGTYLAWTEGRRMLISSPIEGIAELSSNGSDAAIAASPDGKLVVAAWTALGIQSAPLK